MKHFLHSLDKIMMVPLVEMRNMYLPMQINFEFFLLVKRERSFLDITTPTVELS